MKLLQRPCKKIIATTIVLIVLTLSVSVFSVSAAQSEDRDNAAIRLYKALSRALSSRGTATNEYVYMPGVGNSMYPTICDGDNVQVQFYTNGYSIDVGDIIVYNSWMIGMPINCMWIGHRVIGKHKEGDTWYFKTKGDNCPEADGWKVPESAVLGKIISVEHTERSTVPTKTSSQTGSPYVTYPNIPLPQGSETFLLIVGSFCLGAVIAVFDNLKRGKQKNILKRANVCSCYSCRYYQIQCSYALESIYGRIGICKMPEISKGFCRHHNQVIRDFPRWNCKQFEPKMYT